MFVKCAGSSQLFISVLHSWLGGSIPEQGVEGRDWIGSCIHEHTNMLACLPCDGEEYWHCAIMRLKPKCFYGT